MGIKFSIFYIKNVMKKKNDSNKKKKIQSRGGPIHTAEFALDASDFDKYKIKRNLVFLTQIYNACLKYIRKQHCKLNNDIEYQATLVDYKHIKLEQKKIKDKE